MVSIRVENLTKRFGETVAVDDVTFEMKEGELSSILGPSGCGKTTTLRIIAGLESPDSGSVYFDDEDVTALAPHRRNVGFVFQRMSMFPHMKVYDNIAWALQLRKWPKEKIKGRVEEMLELTHLQGLEDRYFKQLSGGQAQRVVIARALAPDPSTLLLDEPLSMLDAKLRDELKTEIREIHMKTGKTSVFVTHNQGEAFSISDRVFLMNEGKFVQSGTAIEIYGNPQTLFAADFIGTNNFLKGTVADVREGDAIHVESSGVIMKAPYQPGFKAKDEVLLCVRADDIDIISEDDKGNYLNALEAKIAHAIFTGRTLVLEAELADQILKIHVTGSERLQYVGKTGMSILCGFSPVAVIRA